MKPQLPTLFAILFICFFTIHSCHFLPTTTEKSPQQTNAHPFPHRLELPKINDTNWFIQHDHYALEYDTAQRHSIWVAYVFHAYYNQKNVTRTNAWAFDPIIPRQYQSLNTTSQTFPSGYDRGHLIASEDRVFSTKANRETFYFSNISPQVSWFNQQIWANLEASVRTWGQAADCDTLYVVTGGAINSGIETLGTLESHNGVTIPKYYFKAIVKRQGNTFDGIAFWLENKRHNSTKVTHEYSMTIRELEQLTNINFFPNLEYVIPGKPNLEELVETTRDTAKWRL